MVSGQIFNQSFCGIDCKKMDLKTFMMDYFTATLKRIKFYSSIHLWRISKNHRLTTLNPYNVEHHMQKCYDDLQTSDREL